MSLFDPSYINTKSVEAKLTIYSCKDRLSRALHVSGIIEQTIFLLTFFSAVKPREIFYRNTNKTEQYYTFEDWILFAALLERGSAEEKNASNI
uniref:Tn3 transposase DDE domain-containing protein n=1 Tax=Thermosporothrix sp. COM3 TaxID=2490863 RepID=A0A455SMB1_9CHLR|nr:hypothetical protein KTC_20760 [Thermosporothrix sp. COM3]